MEDTVSKMPPVTLETERLVLRPFQTNDGPAFHAYMSDPEVSRYSSCLPFSEELSQEIIDSNVAYAQAAPDTLPYSFAITLRLDGQLIGHCRVGRDKDNPGQADIAYFLHRQYWGKGYATEAARALIDYSFQRLHLHRIIAVCVPENIASRRVMEKLGMNEEEPITHYAAQGNFHQGEFKDVTYLRYAIHCTG